MFLYNVTFIVEDTIEDKWLDFLHAEYIPASINTGLFKSCQLLKIVDSPNPGVSFSLQFVAETREKYELYKASFEPVLLGNATSLFPQQVVFFCTLMSYIR